ncbi:MAG: chemotaxis protein CheW [Candidatus Sulfotelmatobacter sp.]|jgi:purine-binding chemotaxis protein CheW
MEANANNSERKSAAHEPRKTQAELLQLVGFRVGGEEFGINILRVQEIIRSQPLTRVPDSPEFMEGVMNLRGKIIPVIALRKRFGLEIIPADKQNRIVVVEIQRMVLGFIVDAVSEVLSIQADSVEPPPRLSVIGREYVSGVGKLGDRLLILLDADRLFSGLEEGMMGGAVAEA